MLSYNQFLESVKKRDEDVIHNVLNSSDAEQLLRVHKKLYRKDYPGTSKSELISKIKVNNYGHLYGIMQKVDAERKKAGV